MKTRKRGIYASVVATMLCLMLGISGYAQKIVYTYDIKTPKHMSYWSYGPGPVVLFGLLFVAGVYLIYHYWANGWLKDDLS